MSKSTPANAPITITSFEELHAFASPRRGDHRIFRGVHDSVRHKLLPSVGRVALRTGVSVAKYEQRVFKVFRETAIPYLSAPPSSVWEWLALAQHHGLPTRLLDWTHNPLVAAYFAVERDFSGDSAIYSLSLTETVDEATQPNPFTVVTVLRYRRSHITQRIAVQKGLFTVHPDPAVPVESARVRKAIVPSGVRPILREHLYRYGISRGSLFPGLDGLASEIAWRYSTEWS